MSDALTHECGLAAVGVIALRDGSFGFDFFQQAALDFVFGLIKLSA